MLWRIAGFFAAFWTMRGKGLAIPGEAPAGHGLNGNNRRQCQDAARAMCS